MKLCGEQKLILFFTGLLLTLCLALFFGHIKFVRDVTVNVIGGLLMSIIVYWLIRRTIEIQAIMDGFEALRTQEERIKKQERYDRIISNDLENWFSKMEYAKIFYNHHEGKLETKLQVEPDSSLYTETEKILGQWGMSSMLDKLQNDSGKLIDKADKAIKTFHTIIDEEIENIPLKKILKPYPLTRFSCSIPQIRMAVFIEINIDKRGFSITTDPSTKIDGWLCHGTTQIAHGTKGVLNNLKRILENLSKNKDVLEQIKLYNEAKNILESQTYIEFQTIMKKNISNYKLEKLLV